MGIEDALMIFGFISAAVLWGFSLDRAIEGKPEAMSILAFFCILAMAAGLIGLGMGTYKLGQTDAISGKIKFKRIISVDKDTSWMRID